MKRMQAIVKLLLCLVVISVHGFSSYSRRRWGGNGGKSQFRMSYLSTLESGIAVAGVVAIHEAGHFLAARSFDMKIDSYNVGYGPKLLAFNETYKGGDIEYALRAFPLGGYVAFPSNVQYDDEKGNELTEPMELDDPDLLQNRPAFQRAVVISAGVIANIFLTWSLASYTACTTGLTHPTFAPGVQVTAAPAVGTKKKLLYSIHLIMFIHSVCADFISPTSYHMFPGCACLHSQQICRFTSVSSRIEV